MAIAERYYGEHADDWGQDLRFYVNVLAWVNNITVPGTADGWRDVHFQANDLIWVPSRAFARGLQGVVNSGSISYNMADSAGLAGFVERTGELWDDFGRAIDLSGRYIGEAVRRHTEQALWDALEALAVMLVAAVGLLAVSTALGAAVGALAGGVGAAPGAAAGFEVGMALLEWLGLGLLLVWVGSALLRVGGAFGDFLDTVWTAHGDQTLLDTGAREFAEAVGTLMGVLVEAVVFLGAAQGIGKAVAALRGTRFGELIGEARLTRWLSERAQTTGEGRGPIPTPRSLWRGRRGAEHGEGEAGHGAELTTGESGSGQGRAPESTDTTLPESKNSTPAANEVPKSWDKFHPEHHVEFQRRLHEFRGNEKLEPTPGLRGGEGQLFLSEKDPGAALKRWYQSRQGDMSRSIQLLEDAGTAVSSNAKLRADMEVVRIHEKGSDWVLRDFDPNSVPLKSVAADANVAAARARVIAELERMESEGALANALANVLKKLKREPPSENIHWSWGNGKILIIDLQ